MVPSSLLNARGLVAISPGPLLGSTLVLAVLWVMHQGRERQRSWNGRPLPPRGYHLSPTRSNQVLVRVGMTADQPSEEAPGFHDWVLAVTTKFLGKPWLLHIPGRPDVLVLSSPQVFEDVQRTFAIHFEKVQGPVEGLAYDVHGEAVASICSGCLRPSIHTQRQLAASLLTSPVMRRMASDLVATHAESLVRVFETAADDNLAGINVSMNVTKLIRRFAMEVFAELGFGLQLGALRPRDCDSSAFEKAVDDIQVRVANRTRRTAVAWKVERLLNVGDEAALSHSVEVVRNLILVAVEAKRTKRTGEGGCDSPIASGAGHVDMLDLLFKQKSSSKSAKDPEFLAQFVLNLVVAARDSMAYTLSMCLQCLAQHPGEQEKLFRELKDVIEPTKVLRGCVRLEAVVKETLRLFPTKPFVRRRAKIDVVFSDGTFVASGTEMAMHVYGMARRENVWGPGCSEFRPQRWIDSRTGKLRPASNYKFNVFLGGPQACLGADLALTEIKAVLAAVTSKVHIDAVEACEQYCGTDKCGDGVVKVRFRRRGPSPPGHYS